MAIYLNPEAFKDKAIPPIKNKEHIINTTYAELKALVDNSQLIPGMQYRITDYITTTIQAFTQSANHPFDIIVIADSNNTLNEIARAIQHEGDTYFTNSNLNAWKIWYSIDNDTNRFAWADTENGKGVIYRMIDEWNNDVPYDFKNIMYNKKLTNGILNKDSGINTWCYTFNAYRVDNDNIYDASVITRNEWIDIYLNECHNNVIKRYYSDDGVNIGSILNDIVFLNTYNIGEYSFFTCNNNYFGFNCSNNSFGDSCSNNCLKSYCSYNSFGNGCSNISLGNSCNNIILGNFCNNNLFGNDCYRIILGNDCSYNSFGNHCYNIAFGADFYGDTKYNYYYNNNFGDNCCYILLEGKTTASYNNAINNYNFAKNLEYIEDECLTINGIRNLSYETKIAKNSSGTLKIYCETDLIK